MSGRALAALCLLLGACQGASGTIAVRIVTAPGSDIMDTVVRARLTLSEPHAEVWAERAADGTLALALDVPAEGNPGQVTFDGFDSQGALVAHGTTPFVPIAAINAEIAIYVARPLSIAAAPAALEPARADMGVAPLPYGVILAGGRRSDGAASAAVAIYNANTHELHHDLEPLPAARAHPIVAAGALGGVYIYGGVDAQGAASSTAWRFHTATPPRGTYVAMSTEGVPARARAAVAPHEPESFVITGDPPLVLSGLSHRVFAYDDAPALAGTATTLGTGEALTILFAGQGNGAGALLLTRDGFTSLAVPDLATRTGHGTVVLRDATFLTVAGAVGDEVVASGVIVDPRTREAHVAEALLATPRRDAAVAATGAFVLVAGGVDATGAVLGDAELLRLDQGRLEPVATLPLLVPRTEAAAVTLPSGHILIAGGRDASGAPIATIELFTPAP